MCTNGDYTGGAIRQQQDDNGNKFFFPATLPSAYHAMVNRNNNTTGGCWNDVLDAKISHYENVNKTVHQFVRQKQMETDEQLKKNRRLRDEMNSVQPLYDQSRSDLQQLRTINIIVISTTDEKLLSSKFHSEMSALMDKHRRRFEQKIEEVENRIRSSMRLALSLQRCKSSLNNYCWNMVMDDNISGREILDEFTKFLDTTTCRLSVIMSSTNDDNRVKLFSIMATAVRNNILLKDNRDKKRDQRELLLQFLQQTLSIL